MGSLFIFGYQGSRRLSAVVCWAAKDCQDETFGLIETAEKAAEIYMKIAHLPRVNTITDGHFHLIEGRFNVKAREGWLD